MPEGQYGLAGLSGLNIVDQLRQHDPNLVRVVEEKRPIFGRKRFSLVSPFCGKRPEFQKYLLSLSRIPTDRAHAVFYDNSGDAEFQAKLKDTLRRKFSSYRLVEDRNPPQFVNFAEPPSNNRMRLITKRIADVYGHLYQHHVPRTSPRVLNLEDDVEIPADAWERLNRVLDDEQRVGTVIGTCCDRRLDYGARGRPIAFDFRVEGRVAERSPESVKLVPVPDLPFGCTPIGAGHMGCWLTRTETLDTCPMGESELYGIHGHDLVWGWRLHEAGWSVANDWSVRCRHWFMRGRAMQSV